MNLIKVKFWLDLAALILLVVVLVSGFIGRSERVIHLWSSIFLIGAIAVHLILNFGWIKAFFRK